MTKAKQTEPDISPEDAAKIHLAAHRANLDEQREAELERAEQSRKDNHQYAQMPVSNPSNQRDGHGKPIVTVRGEP